MSCRASLFFSVLFFASVVSSAHSQPFENLFPDSRTVYSSQSEHKDYRLALGPLVKNNGIWQAEREEKIGGTLYRRTIEVNDSYSRQEAVNTVTAFFSSLDGRLLFSCSGLDCGSSAAWANESFGVKQLYGLDRYQNYWVWELGGASGNRIAIAYVVQRGNKRVYAQVDLMALEAGGESIVSSPEAILSELDSKKYFVFPGLSFSGSSARFDSRHVNAIAAAMERDPRLQLYLVGHDYQGDDLQQQVARSKGYAEQLRALLEKAGVRADRLQSEGVGPLAPRGKHASARIELVAR